MPKHTGFIKFEQDAGGWTVRFFIFQCRNQRLNFSLFFISECGNGEGAGIEAFTGRAIGPDDLMALKQEVMINDRGGNGTVADAAKPKH